MNSIFALLGLLCAALVFPLPPRATSAEKILAVEFMSSKSHRIVYETLLLELAKRGHKVTIVTPVPKDKKVQNVRDIGTLTDYIKAMSEMGNIFEKKERSEEMNPFTMLDWFDKLCRDTYDLPQIKSLMKEKFDLIISQPMFNECQMGFIHHFNTTSILINLFSAPPMHTWVTGSPAPWSFTPHFFLKYTDRMTYWERMHNFGFTLVMDAIQQYYFKPKMTALYREMLGDPNIPDVDTILSNTSLILSNSHFSLTPPKPFLPEVVDVGGMHCRPAQPLPKDLEDFISKFREHGFIYFSMGSVIQATTMPEKYRVMLLNTFSKLKQGVIWKWEEDMPDLPKNVKLGKWLPQQDILGHPKIKMFITHGGYGGITEAVYHGTPLLGIPMFGDQQLNMQKSESTGFALTLDFNNLSEEILLAGINRILSEPSFTNKVKALSKVFQDQPDRPLDRAVFWTEYVMRHKGAIHMRSAARDLNFIQYHSLDIIGSYLAIILVILYAIYATIRFILRKVCCLGSSKHSKSLQNRTNKKTN